MLDGRVYIEERGGVDIEEASLSAIFFVVPLTLIELSISYTQFNMPCKIQSSQSTSFNDFCLFLQW